MRFVRLLAGCMLMPGIFVLAQAQTYPSRPVRVIIPFTPGGGSDVVARVLAQKLGATTGQNFVIDNRPGAGGNIGSTPEQAAQFVKAESVRWAEVIRASGAKAD